MPRPTKYNANVADRILTALRAGNTRTASALFAGIDYSTLTRWAKRDAECCNALDHAEAEAEVRCVAILMRAVQDGDTAAAKWWLERRRSSDWRQQESISIEVYARQRAAELGLDEAQAVAAATRILSGQR